MNEKIIRIALIALLIPLPLLLSTTVMIAHPGYAFYLFEKHGVNEQYESLDVGSYHKKVTSYLFGSSDAMPDSLELTERELTHMYDVKQIVSSLPMIIFALIILIAICFLFQKSNFKALLGVCLRKSGVYSIMISFLLFLLFLIGFSLSFTLFHKLLFEGDSWLFEQSAHIINIYPFDFFRDMFIGVAVLTIIISLVMTRIGATLQKQYKPTHSK